MRADQVYLDDQSNMDSNWDMGLRLVLSDLFQDDSYQVVTPEAVDLGLPSGLKWASFNLGASAPEEYGDYYAWGETEPYYNSLDPLTWKPGKEAGYDWASYKWCMGASVTMTKYCYNNCFGYQGFTDTKTVLDPEDDTANVNLGGSWHIPTDAEWMELMENCTWNWTMRNGINGYHVTASNGNSIFLPAADCLSKDSGDIDVEYGVYWSSSLSTEDNDTYFYPCEAWRMVFHSTRVFSNCNYRFLGSSIRPVCDD
jgi:hypothetical protein